MEHGFSDVLLFTIMPSIVKYRIRQQVYISYRSSAYPWNEMLRAAHLVSLSMVHKSHTSFAGLGHLTVLKCRIQDHGPELIDNHSSHNTR